MVQERAPGWHRSLTVAQAAERLGVTAQRVRVLIADGELSASRFVGRWAIDPTSVERRMLLGRTTGRNFTLPHAWGVLFLADGLSAPWLNPVERSKLKALLAAQGLAVLRPRLGRRAARLAFRAHPSDLARIAAEPGLMLTGASASPRHGQGIIDSGYLEAYVRQGTASRLKKRYALGPSENPNVILRVMDPCPATFPTLPQAPTPAVAIDLLDDPEPRAQEVGGALLARYRP